MGSHTSPQDGNNSWSEVNCLTNPIFEVLRDEWEEKTSLWKTCGEVMMEPMIYPTTKDSETNVTTFTLMQ